MITIEAGVHAQGAVNFGKWALKVITWDAVLPALVVFFPLCVGFLFPNRRGIVEIIAVVLPIVAFLLRFRAGKRHIDSNQCSGLTKSVQLCVFCLGILPLALVDSVVILTEIMPRGPSVFGTKTCTEFMRHV